LQLTETFERKPASFSVSLPLSQEWCDEISPPVQLQERKEVYILELEQKKWYVGISNDPESRLKSHNSGEGSRWTKKYPPVRIHKRIQNPDSFDEDKYTKIYMAKYGIENVRGGSYCQLELPEYSLTALKKELKTAIASCV
jgi:hypothetical protein